MTVIATALIRIVWGNGEILFPKRISYVSLHHYIYIYIYIYIYNFHLKMMGFVVKIYLYQELNIDNL